MTSDEIWKALDQVGCVIAGQTGKISVDYR
jgi:hypothetical protein